MPSLGLWRGGPRRTEVWIQLKISQAHDLTPWGFRHKKLKFSLDQDLPAPSLQCGCGLDSVRWLGTWGLAFCQQPQRRAKRVRLIRPSLFLLPYSLLGSPLKWNGVPMETMMSLGSRRVAGAGPGQVRWERGTLLRPFC